MGNFKTIFKESESLNIVKKSKFIGYAKPIESVEEATEFIEKIKKKHWNASHNVPVYVLGDKFQIQKYSDDGEPSGTAGVPILEILKKRGITNIVVVVTRYFGGTKLGVGGLVRAYSQSLKSVLEEAMVIEKIEYQNISIKLSYTLHGKLQNFLSLNEEYFLVDTLYTEEVEVKLLIKNEDVEVFEKKVIDLTNDKCIIEISDFQMLSISNEKWIK